MVKANGVVNISFSSNCTGLKLPRKIGEGKHLVITKVFPITLNSFFNFFRLDEKTFVTYKFLFDWIKFSFTRKYWIFQEWGPENLVGKDQKTDQRKSHLNFLWRISKNRKIYHQPRELIHNQYSRTKMKHPHKQNMQVY